MFARTPKGLLTGVLLGLTLVAGRVEGVRLVGPGWLTAVGVAALMDAPLLRWQKGRWQFPSGAVLTGMLIALVLSSFEPWYVFAAAAAIAIAGKYADPHERSRMSSIRRLPGWWPSSTCSTPRRTGGARCLRLCPPRPWPLLLGTGAVRAPTASTSCRSCSRSWRPTSRCLRLQPLSWTRATWRRSLWHPIYWPSSSSRASCSTDPPTSPTRVPAQVVCGILVASVSVGIFLWNGGAHYLLGGVLAGNVFEAVRRSMVRVRPA